jgi:hypothetical protein
MATVLISKEKMWRLVGECKDVTKKEIQSEKDDQVGVVQTRKDCLSHTFLSKSSFILKKFCP